MNKTPTLVFSDLDGTLLDHFSYKSTPAKATLKQLKAKSIPVICNTSKTFAEVELICNELGLNTPFVVENGAAIYIPKTYFDEQPSDTTSQGDYWVKSFALTREYWLDLIAEYRQIHSVKFIGFNDLSTLQLAELTGLSESNAGLAKQRQYSEPIQWLGDTKSKQMFIEYLNNSGAKILEGGRFIHVIGECDKGKALTWLTELYKSHFGVEKIHTIALGDSHNDVAMLEIADISVLVRSPVHNFPKLVKQDEVIRTTEFGPKGWASALNLLLIHMLKDEVIHG